MESNDRSIVEAAPSNILPEIHIYKTTHHISSALDCLKKLLGTCTSNFIYDNFLFVMELNYKYS